MSAILTDLDRGGAHQASVTLLNWQPMMLFHRRLFQIRSFEAIFEVFCLFLPLSGLFLPQIWLKTCRERILAWGLIIYKCQLPNWQHFLSKTTDGLRNAKTNNLNSTNMHNSGFFNGFRPKFRVIPWEFATKLALEKCKFDQLFQTVWLIE